MNLMGIRFGIFKNPIYVAVQENVAPYPHNMRRVCAIYCVPIPANLVGGPPAYTTGATQRPAGSFRHDDF